MSVSAIQMPLLPASPKSQPVVATAQNGTPVTPIKAVQPVSDHPMPQMQQHAAGQPPQTAPAKAAMPDLYFPDPLPDLPKIDPPAPKTNYPAALQIIGGSARDKLR